MTPEAPGWPRGEETAVTKTTEIRTCDTRGCPHCHHESGKPRPLSPADVAWQFGEAERNNLFSAIEHLALAAFRNFSTVLPQMDDGDLHGFELIDSWNILKRPGTDEYFWNPGAIAIGAVIGVFSSLIAMRRYLKI